MSVRAMTAVWDMIGGTPDERLVMLAYADHADDEGANIFPAVARIAKKTGLTERGVQKITRRLTAIGLLIPDGSGPRGTRRWKMPLPLPGVLGSPPAERVNAETVGVNLETPGGEPGDTRTLLTNHQEPSIRTSRESPRDVLFDAIAEVCQVDPATAGASVGKVKAKLSKAEPPYTPSEVKAFGAWWWSGGFRKRPPRIWDLQEQIGIVRNGHIPGPMSKADRDAKMVAEQERFRRLKNGQKP